MMDQREAKLTSVNESPLDPDLPICDPHHHLWEQPGNRYGVEDLISDMARSGHNIVETVFVECGTGYRQGGPPEMRPVGETEFVQGVSAQSSSGQSGKTRIAAGIVGFADLTLGKAVEPVLEAHIAAGKNRFRGIRHRSVWDASPEIPSYTSPPRGLLLNPRFREGFACLKKYGLSFDAWLYFHQLMELVDLAKTYPDIEIVLDHIGGLIRIGPYAVKRDAVFQEWKHGIATLSQCPNVAVKLGGLGMPRCGFDWHERTTQPGSEELAKVMGPYYLLCVEHFGVSRCMFESNFPVDKVSYSYAVMWNAFKRITRDFSPQERAALFHNTAVKVYQL